MPDNTIIGVDADLATLRHVIAYLAEQSSAADIDGTLPQDNGYAALARVEAELSRLREQRDEWKDTAEEVGGELRRSSELREAAEARCAQLEDDLDRERDNHAALLRINQHAAEEWEARCARLQQALAKIRDSGPRPRTIRSDLAYVILLQGIAREALAGLDTPADAKGFSEETCVRCGWRMGSPPMNCQNDDTPHRFPSQDTPAEEEACVEAELSRLREEAAGYARTIVALWEEIAPGESYEELGGATIVELATRLRQGLPHPTIPMGGALADSPPEEPT